MQKIIYRTTFSLCIATAFLFGCSEKSRDVPTELFGVRLGATYSLGEGTTNNFGTLPIKKMGGIERSMTIGEHFYFQPINANKLFEYKENKKKPTDEYFSTTHHLYLLPIIPNSITTIDELNKFKLENIEVAMIDWSDIKKSEKDAYFWVSDICKTFAADIGVKPEVNDDFKNDFYRCTFKKDERQLEINNIGDLVIFRLAYNKEILDRKVAAIDKAIRKMQAKEMLK